MDSLHISVPFDDDALKHLRAGDRVLISGVLYTARDAAHKRFIETMNCGDALPVALKGQVIYYVGPAPASLGHAVGPAGPTTSSRLDFYTLPLLDYGVKGFIGKGYRSEEVKTALVKYRAVYLAAVGGAAALIAQSIKSSQVVAYPELGTEAVHKFIVENFPAIVINDIYGGDAYTDGRAAYLKQRVGE